MEQRCFIRNLALDGFTRDEIETETGFNSEEIRVQFTIAHRDVSDKRINPISEHYVFDGKCIVVRRKEANKPSVIPPPMQSVQTEVPKPSSVSNDSGIELPADIRQMLKDKFKQEARQALNDPKLVAELKKQAMDEVIAELSQ